MDLCCSCQLTLVAEVEGEKKAFYQLDFSPGLSKLLIAELTAGCQGVTVEGNVGFLLYFCKTHLHRNGLKPWIGNPSPFEERLDSKLKLC